jgi:hypothetical protein
MEVRLMLPESARKCLFFDPRDALEELGYVFGTEGCPDDFDLIDFSREAESLAVGLAEGDVVGHMGPLVGGRHIRPGGDELSIVPERNGR